jgi:serine/threonine protein kinase/predicted Zn-dependent protease
MARAMIVFFSGEGYPARARVNVPASQSFANDALALGQVIGGYRLDKEIGSGGTGRVFEATQLKLSRIAAIKILSADVAREPELVARFYQEARTVNEVRHPNIVDVVDFIEIEEPRCVAYVMELLRGPSLKEVLADRRLSVVQAVNIAIQLADALAAVHAVNVIHRDLKPSNVIVTGSLEGDLSSVPSIKLLELGIAKLPPGGGERPNPSGVILGTPAYVAPEQVGGDPIVPATDVYAIGEILFEMLAGTPLFFGEAIRIMHAKLSQSPPPIALPPETPNLDRLREIIEICVAFDPAARPSAKEIKEKLEACQARPPPQTRLPTFEYVPSLPPNAPHAQPAAREPSLPKRISTLPGPRARSELPRPVIPVERPKRTLRTVLLGFLAFVLLVAWLSGSITALIDALGIMPSIARSPPARRRAPIVNPLETKIAAWRDLPAIDEGATEAALAEARKHQLKDTWSSFVRADQLLRAAIAKEPKSPLLLARWAENVALWKEDMLSKAELEELSQTLEYAAHAGPNEPAVVRAACAVALARGDLSSAQKLAEQAIARDAGDAIAHLFLASAIVNGDAARALIEAEEARRAQPDLRRSDRIVARALANQGHYSAALKQVSRRAAENKDDGVALVLSAALEREVGREADAIATYKRAGALAEDGVLARIRAGEILLQRGEPAQIEPLLKTVAQDAAVIPFLRARAAVMLARAALAAGKMPQAQDLADLAKQIAPDDAHVRHLEAEIAFELGEIARAEAVVDRLMIDHQREPALFVLLARAKKAKVKSEDSAKLLRTAIGLDRSNADLRMIAAAMYLSFGASGQALSLVDEAGGLDPFDRLDPIEADAFPISPVAIAEAQAQIVASSKDEDIRAGANALLGVFHYFHGRNVPAKAHLAQALKADPRHVVALLYDAQIAAEEGATDAGERSIRKLLGERPYLVAAHIVHARLAMARGRLAEAKQALEEARRQQPDQFMVGVEQAALDLKSGDSDAVKRLVAAMKERPYLLRTRRLLFEAGY